MNTEAAIPADPRLAVLMEVWPALPGNVQAEILRLAHMATAAGQGARP